MTAEEAKELIPLLAVDELEEPKRSELLVFLEATPGAKAQYEILRDTFLLLAEELGDVPEAPKPLPFRKGLPWVRPLLMAAACIAIVASVYSLVTSMTHSERVGSRMASPVGYADAYDSDLPDPAVSAKPAARVASNQRLSRRPGEIATPQPEPPAPVPTEEKVADLSGELSEANENLERTITALDDASNNIARLQNKNANLLADNKLLRKRTDDMTRDMQQQVAQPGRKHVPAAPIEIVRSGEAGEPTSRLAPAMLPPVLADPAQNFGNNETVAILNTSGIVPTPVAVPGPPDWIQAAAIAVAPGAIAPIINGGGADLTITASNGDISDARAITVIAGTDLPVAPDPLTVPTQTAWESPGAGTVAPDNNSTYWSTVAARISEPSPPETGLGLGSESVVTNDLNGNGTLPASISKQITTSDINFEQGGGKGPDRTTLDSIALGGTLGVSADLNGPTEGRSRDTALRGQTLATIGPQVIVPGTAIVNAESLGTDGFVVAETKAMPDERRIPAHSIGVGAGGLGGGGGAAPDVTFTGGFAGTAVSGAVPAASAPVNRPAPAKPPRPTLTEGGDNGVVPGSDYAQVTGVTLPASGKLFKAISDREYGDGEPGGQEIRSKAEQANEKKAIERLDHFTTVDTATGGLNLQTSAPAGVVHSITAGGAVSVSRVQAPPPAKKPATKLDREVSELKASDTPAAGGKFEDDMVLGIVVNGAVANVADVSLEAGQTFGFQAADSDDSSDVSLAHTPEEKGQLRPVPVLRAAKPKPAKGKKKAAPELDPESLDIDAVIDVPGQDSLAEIQLEGLDDLQGLGIELDEAISQSPSANPQVGNSISSRREITRERLAQRSETDLRPSEHAQKEAQNAWAVESGERSSQSGEGSNWSAAAESVVVEQPTMKARQLSMKDRVTAFFRFEDSDKVDAAEVEEVEEESLQRASIPVELHEEPVQLYTEEMSYMMEDMPSSDEALKIQKLRSDLRVRQRELARRIAKHKGEDFDGDLQVAPQPLTALVVAPPVPDEPVDDSPLPPAPPKPAAPVNPFVLTDKDAQSTFALEADTAAYTLSRRYIRKGYNPPPAVVRMEEFVNAFDYQYPAQTEHTFTVHAEAARAPFGKELTLLKVGVRGKVLGRDGRKRAHLIFVVDASGSMAREDRMPLVQHALSLLVGQLDPGDRVTLVTYGNRSRLVMEAMPASERGRIGQALAAIECGNATNMLSGIQTGYELARRHYKAGDVNRIILCSDGVANLGPADADAMLAMVDDNRGQGITFTSVGVGAGSYDDNMMEQLANRGDGNYVYIDSPAEARRVFVDNFSATLQNIARDVKIQVVFNPDKVRRYRLIGYENRDIADKDFRNDKVDAGEIGSGQSATALYEIELQPNAESADFGTVFVRYKSVDDDTVTEFARRLAPEIDRLRTPQDDPRFFLAACVAEFAEILRESEHANTRDFHAMRQVLMQVANALPLDNKVQELLKLVENAQDQPVFGK